MRVIRKEGRLSQDFRYISPSSSNNRKLSGRLHPESNVRVWALGLRAAAGWSRSWANRPKGDVLLNISSEAKDKSMAYLFAAYHLSLKPWNLHLNPGTVKKKIQETLAERDLHRVGENSILFQIPIWASKDAGFRECEARPEWWLMWSTPAPVFPTTSTVQTLACSLICITTLNHVGFQH